MNKTKIEWVKNPDGSPGYTWNPITGCLNHNNGLCKGGGFPCYAYKLANGRLKQRYLGNENIADYEIMTYPRHIECIADPFYPRFWEERLAELPNDVIVGKERGIFVCDMGDLFGIGVPESWTRQVLERIQGWPEYRFYILTKQAARLPEFSPFPENCWVGVTATNTSMAWIASKQLSQIEARVKFLSLEPLLSWETSIPYTTENIVAGLNGSLDWLIIGAQTNPYKPPEIAWVREIVEAADKAGIPVFLKDNLRPLLIPEDCSKPNYLTEDIFWASEKAQLRQEMPE